MRLFSLPLFLLLATALPRATFAQPTELSPQQPATSNALTGKPRMTITNHEHGSELRYSVVLLKGTCDRQAKSLKIRNFNAPRDAALIQPVLHEGRFKALVELVEGENVIELSTELNESSAPPPVTLNLTYRPQTNPYYVRVVWMTDASGDTTFAAPSDEVTQDYEARLRTAALLMQTFTAERMNELGYGFHTFRLKRDADGQVIIDTLRGDKDRETYFKSSRNRGLWYQQVYRWINREHPDPYAKNMVLAAYTRKDPETGEVKAHTALGGGNLGLFGSASVFSWPRDIQGALEVFHDDTLVDATQVNDDSAYRSTYWGLAATTLGATLHEMGHTFGLNHTTDRFDIMTRGFDHFGRAFTFYDPKSKRNRKRFFHPGEEGYFAPISASHLRWSRWFQLEEQQYTDDSSPTIKINHENGMIRLSAPSGIRWIGFETNNETYSFREYQHRKPPQEVTLSEAEVNQALDGKPLQVIVAMSSNGQQSMSSVDGFSQ